MSRLKYRRCWGKLGVTVYKLYSKYGKRVCLARHGGPWTRVSDSEKVDDDWPTNLGSEPKFSILRVLRMPT
jgi:hypothetical protein